MLNLNYMDIYLEMPTYGDSRENWTETALECYQRRCNCQDCPIPHPTGLCKMKSCVLALFRQFGSPEEIIKEKEKDRQKVEYILKAIDEGKTRKQMAEELNISLYTLKKYIQKTGIRMLNEQMYKRMRGNNAKSNITNERMR